jgi:hypothetical protein
MKVLVACESSGIVREAFKKKGHDAWSCDLLPTEIEGQHIIGDALPLLEQHWDLIIAHPPCTYLTNADSNRWAAMRKGEKTAGYNILRHAKRYQAIHFFMAFVNCDCCRLAIENPIGIMNSRYRKADQTIHPFFFGHAQAKKTCLWLKGLPKLVPTKIVDVPFGPNGMRVGIKYTKIPKGEERWKFRSRTFQGIADAMADQWGNL